MSRVEYKNEQEDKWFKWQGQKPPERIPHLTDDERDEIMRQNMERHHCDFYQVGNMVVCDNGEFTHGKNVGVGKLLDKEASDKAGKAVLRTHGPTYRDVANA